jgi:hypothetical protein
VTTVNHDLSRPTSPNAAGLPSLGRRQLFRLGGLSVATAAVVAACGGTESPGIARIGLAPTTTDLPPANISDSVLLRTAASIERSAIGVYTTALDAGLLPSAAIAAAERFRDDHVAHAEAVDALTTEVGGEPFTCGNPRLEEITIPAILAAVLGDEAAGIPASDNPQRDVMNIAFALESYAAETYQSFVPMLSLPSLRGEAIRIAGDEARHSSVLALAITGRPAGYVQREVPASPPQIPVAYALPSRFGTLGGVPLVIGAADEVGQRRAFSLDTPSLNTFVYDSTEGSC